MPSWSLFLPGVPGVTFDDTLQFTDVSVRVTNETGVWLPPEAMVAPGYVYQRTQVHPRIIVLTLTPRMRLEHQQFTRQSLAQFLAPDRVRSGPLELRYAGAVRTLALPVVYAPESVPAGPDLDRANANPLAFRFLSYDPIWRTVTSTSVVLSTSGSLTANYLVVRRVPGWTDPLSTINGTVRVVLPVFGTDTLYVGGDFTVPGTRMAQLTRGTGGAYTWSAMGGGLDGSVRALVRGQDGTLYAGGLFTNRVSAWNGTSWAALATLAGGNAYALAVGQDGTLYAGGDFAGAQVIVWNGSNWASIGTSPGNTVQAMLVGADGTLYVGLYAGGLKQWNGSAWVTCGSITGSIDSLALGLDGTIYVGGLVSLDGGSTYVNVVAWNGYGLAALGLGLNGEVFCLTVDPASGMLYAGGVFTKINGGITLPSSLARWSGSGWYALDTALPAATQVETLGVGPRDLQLVVGMNTTGTMRTSGVQNAAPLGSAAGVPVIAITGPGRVWELINGSTGATLFFDLVLLIGEVVTLDMVAGTITSTMRGNLLGKLLAGSAWGTFKLAPLVDSGNSVLMFADATVTAALSWQDRYWSLDGADV